MEKRRRRLGLFVVVGAFALLAWSNPHNRASIEILTHESGDLNPRRMQAAIDLGLVGISVLYTWTSNLTR